MKDAELEREIERAARNTRKLRALQAEHERSSAELAALSGAPSAERRVGSPSPHPHPTYSVRG